jgi:ATP-dependent Lon protease
MYMHDKNRNFARFLKLKAQEPDAEKHGDLCSDVAYEDETSKLVSVFDIDRMKAIVDENDRSSNLRKSHKRLLAYVEEMNGDLPLAQLPPTIFDDMDSLSKRFPNFAAVVDFYRQEFALAKLAENPVFSAQPLLVAGPPGIGKTFFCSELARIVNTNFEAIDMSSMTAGFVLSGNSSRWADSSYGKVVKALAHGRKANPLIVVDEIDKAGGDKRYDSLGALYSLLEQETAKKFVDEALEIPIDASYAVWVATANYLERIPEPIRSRFTVVEVAAPTIEQMASVVDSVYAKVRENHSWGAMFHESLSQSVIDKLVASKIEPRLLQKVLVGACGRAVLRTAKGYSPNSKLEITVEDLALTELAVKPAISPIPKHTAYQPDVVVMPIFGFPQLSNEQNQEEEVCQWAVYELELSESRTHHLVGFIPRRNTGRVTSPIRQFDRKSMQLRTFSGSIYKLQGQPGLSREAEVAWSLWKEKNDISGEVDVTHQYYFVH